MIWNECLYTDDKTIPGIEEMSRNEKTGFSSKGYLYSTRKYEYIKEDVEVTDSIIIDWLERLSKKEALCEIYACNDSSVYAIHKLYGDLSGMCCGLKVYVEKERFREVYHYFLNQLGKEKNHYMSFLVNSDEHVDCFIEYADEEVDIKQICSQFSKSFPETKLTGVKSHKRRWADYEVYYSEKGSKQLKTSKIRYEREADSTYTNLTKSKFWAQSSWIY